MDKQTVSQGHFFALYMGQDIWTCPQWENKYPVDLYFYNSWDEIEEGDNRFNIDNNFIELKPLSSLTKNDYDEILDSNIMNPAPWEDFDVTDGKLGGINISDVTTIDFLRSKGYALPFMGVSVEKLVEYGWVRLKGDPKA
ncbi:hypothetical protein ACLCDV_07875 [Sphingobacterium sp. Lzh-3]|uniref:hypothetical protein n=1 Tax=Sphingobacterium sp. Lzh-3 TaxID=3382150 RepID=UPI00398CA5A4